MKKYIIPAVIIAILAAAGYLLLQPQPWDNGEGTMVGIDPVNQTVPSLSNFTVSVLCVPGQPVKAYEFSISFNPSFIQANSVNEGNIFEGYETFFNPGIINNTAGTIIHIYGLIIGQGNISSNGTLVTINFTASDAMGISDLNLQMVGVTNEIAYILVDVYNGSVRSKAIYVMALDTGWNLISWPTTDILSKANITVAYNNTTYTFQEGCNNIIIAPFVYMYNGSAYVETNYFYPYFGYWFYSHKNGVVLTYEP